MKFLEVDATTLKSGIVAHGVNRRLAMGSGIAGALARTYPLVRDQYLTRNDPIPRLGSIDLVTLPRSVGESTGLWVVNCYTQESAGHDGKRYADADAVACCLSKVFLLASHLGLPQIYVPRIGCDLGGLDWKGEIKPLFQQEEDYFNELLVDNSMLKKVELIVIDVPGGKWGNE